MPGRVTTPSSAMPTRGVAPAARPKLQRAMSRYASVVRDGDGLQQLAQELDSRRRRVISTAAPDFEDVALTTAARAVAAAALARTESRGCHHRSDYPGHRPGAGAQPGASRWPAADGAQCRRADRGSQGDRPRPGRGSALRARRHHAGDGARRRDDDGLDGDPRAGRDRRRRHRAAGARRGARARTATGRSTASTTAHGWRPARRC